MRRSTAAPDGQDVLKNAYVALRRAKALGIGQSLTFSPDIGQAARERTTLLRDLRQAFERRELSIVYQPQIDLSTGKIIGAEALLRWKHPSGEFIPPDRFIPIAEQSGLIVAMGRWLLPEALRTLKRFQQAGFEHLRMAVNVSSIQLRQPSFLDFVNETLAETGTSPNFLELEITESAAILGAGLVEQYLHELKKRGVGIAIDDFGTGFSSLSYLDRLPADRIKIDRAFVNALDNGDPGARGARIAEMVVPLGRKLGMKVLAEGIETEAQARRLGELGCDDGQGFLYARPMPIEELKLWLAGRAST